MAITIPSEETLPPSPLRELTQALYDLYERAGRPGGRKIALWTQEDNELPDVVSHTLALDLIQGSVPRPTWMKVHSLARVLADQAGVRDVEACIERIRDLWIQSTNPSSPEAKAKDVYKEDEPAFKKLPDASGHFARLAYEWGIQHPEARPTFLQGSVAITYSSPAGAATHPEIYDTMFQADVINLQEAKILRRDSHGFHTSTTHRPTSFHVHGPMSTGSNRTSCFISVDVHLNGAVSVYFRENYESGTLEDFVGWGVFGAWRIALQIHAYLGSTGQAHAHVVANQKGISNLPPVRRFNREKPETDIHFETGPFAFEAVHDPGNPYYNSFMKENARSWSSTVRRGLLVAAYNNSPESMDDSRLAEEWSLQSVQESLMLGRFIK